ncbi:DUF6288 domain-containing protein [Rubritalea tangerina]|uniref:DUF6288 domain-containing protein n=1 Tax=Rubritalea tangerina TaxID=430798 RepID=A0ABW4Z9C0_9BACT
MRTVRERKHPHPAGNAAGIFVLLLILVILAGLSYLQKLKLEEDQNQQATEEVAPTPVAEPVKEVVKELPPEPVIEPELEPEPAIDEEPKIVDAPTPEPPKEKSELDLYLEKKFPFPTFTPLEKIVQNWQSVPERAFPEHITVAIATDYQNGGEVLHKEASHQAIPVEYSPEQLQVALPDNDGYTASVKVEDTNFKEAVATLYQQKIDARNQKIIAQREAYKPKAEKELAAIKLKEERERERMQLEANQFDPKRYGRRFRGDFWPVTKNNKNEEYEHEIPLGPLCGTGAVLFEKREFRVVDLWDKGPAARAGLEVDDVVTKVNGKRFAEYAKSSAGGGEGVPIDLAEAILDAQASSSPLILTVQRGEESQEISIELPALPKFSETFPNACPRSYALSEAAAEYIVENQQDQGNWRINDYSAAWCGLALLSTGSKDYSREIKKAARFYADKYDLGPNPSTAELVNPSKGKGGGSNWQVSMMGIFLAEYYLATGDRQVLRALDHCCRSMEARLSPGTGRLGHNGPDLPYEGKGLIVINTHAHLMWALASHIHGQDNWNWDPWKLSYKSIAASVAGDGAVGYNFSARGGSQSANRTGATVTFLKLADKRAPELRSMSDWLVDNPNHYLNVHAMSFIGPIYSFMGLRNISERSYKKNISAYQWLFALVQPANYDHGSYYYGGRGNTGGDEYCNKRFCGNIMSVLVLNSHKSDTLWLYGNRKTEWLKYR